MNQRMEELMSSHQSFVPLPPNLDEALRRLNKALSRKEEQELDGELDIGEQLRKIQDQLDEQGRWLQIASLGGALKTGIFAEELEAAEEESDEEIEARAMLRRLLKMELSREALSYTDKRKRGIRGRD